MKIINWSDKGEVLMAVSVEGIRLRLASPELRSDREVVFAAIRSDVMSISYASNELKADKVFIFEALKLNSRALLFASSDVRDLCGISIRGGVNAEGFDSIGLVYDSEVAEARLLNAIMEDRAAEQKSRLGKTFGACTDAKKSMRVKV